MSNKENDLYESLIQPSPQTSRSLQTSQAPQTSEEVFDKKTKEFREKAKEFCEKRAKLDEATQEYIKRTDFCEKISSNYKELLEFYSSNDVYKEHVKALYKAFKKHQKYEQVSDEDKRLIQKFKKAYKKSLKSAYRLSHFEVVKYSSMAIAIFKEEPEEGIKILELCTEFLKAHNEWEIAGLKMEQAQQQAQQQASQSYVGRLARNIANSNSNSNEKYCSIM